jgi:hypothetical protein
MALFAASWPKTPPPFRANLSGAIGLWSRGRRQARAWAPHIARCHAEIAAALDTLPARRTVAVLGSGPLFDVPMPLLTRAFGRVLLIDHAHIAAFRAPVGAERQWRDLAGPGALDFLANISDLDWVISLNLVSQMARVADNPRAIVATHLSDLARLNKPVTLISDLRYETRTPSGALAERIDLWHGEPAPTPGATWPWTVAPRGEEGPNERIHTVAAWRSWGKPVNRVPIAGAIC